MKLIRLAAVFVSLLVASTTAHANLLDDAKKTASRAGSAIKDTAKQVGDTAQSAASHTVKLAHTLAFAAKSITDAAIYGVDSFPKGVQTKGYYTPELEKQCPGVGLRINGCSVPLYDKISKKFKKLLLPACNDHDVCYNLTDAKMACDVAFRDRMYKLCDGLSVKKTKGLCRVTAHTWFAAVAHSDESLAIFVQERKWSKATCTPVPELTTTTVKKR